VCCKSDQERGKVGEIEKTREKMRETRTRVPERENGSSREREKEREEERGIKGEKEKTE